MDSVSRQKTIYLLQEACLFLCISYLVLLGGTFNGLVIPALNRINIGFVIIIGITWVIYRLINKTSEHRTGLDAGIVLILIAGIISTIFSVDPRRSLIGLVIIVIAILVYYFFVDLIRNGVPTQLINKVLILVSGFILFFGVRELLLWYGGWIEIGGFEQLIPPATYRVRAFIGHPNLLAAYLNLLIPLALANIVLAKKNSIRVILFFWLLLAFILVFFTSSRGGWLGTFVALIVFILGTTISRWDWIKRAAAKLVKNKTFLVMIVLVVIAGFGAMILLLNWQSSHPTHPSDWTNIFASRNYIWQVAQDMFDSNLITGNGIFTYGTEYLKARSVPPSMLLAHAHNFYLNVASEQGLIGLICYGIYFISLMIVMLKAWQEHTSLDKIEITGLAAGLFGLAAHSMFETPQSLPVLLILPAILVAQVTAGIKWESKPIRPIIKNVLLAGLWIFSVGLMMFDFRVVNVYEQGLNMAANEQWDEAAEYMERVTKMDPGNALYWFQKGQVYGHIALDDFGYLRDKDALDNAVESYQSGLEIESDYSVNWMNLGLLYRANGDLDQALDSMVTAVNQSPRQPAYLMTLGNLFEQLDKNSNAEETYWEALEIEPDWANAPYFQGNDLRRGVIDQWINKNNSEVLGNERLSDSWHYYQMGDYQKSLGLLKDISIFNDPEAYWLLGKIYTKLNDYQEAEKSLQTALWMGTTNKSLKTNIYIGLGDVALLQEKERAAFDAYSAANDLLEGTTSYGVGDKGETQYSWYLYYKNSIKQDLLPGMISPVYSEDMLDGLLFLLEWYCSNEQQESAMKIFEKIIYIRPDGNEEVSAFFQTCGD